MRTEYLQIGEILKPQGIKGEIKLRADSPDMQRYSRLENIFIQEGQTYSVCRVIHGRAAGGFAYLQLEGIDNRDKAESLRGKKVYVDRAHALSLQPGQHYICDLIGCTAYLEDGERLGVLRDIQSPNVYCDVYLFDTDRGVMMMPALKKAIKSIDTDKSQIILDRQTLSEIAVWEDEPTEKNI